MQNKEQEINLTPPDESVLTKEELVDLRNLIIRIDKLCTQDREGVDVSMRGINGLLPVSRQAYTRTWTDQNYNDQRMWQLGQVSIMFSARVDSKGAIADSNHNLQLLEVMYNQERLSVFGTNAISGPWWQHIREHVARIKIKVAACEREIEDRLRQRIEREKQEKDRQIALQNKANERLREKYRRILTYDGERGSILRGEENNVRSKSRKKTPFESVVDRATPEYLEGINKFWDKQREAAKKGQKEQK